MERLKNRLKGRLELKEEKDKMNLRMTLVERRSKLETADAWQKRNGRKRVPSGIEARAHYIEEEEEEKKKNG